MSTFIATVTFKDSPVDLVDLIFGAVGATAGLEAPTRTSEQAFTFERSFRRDGVPDRAAATACEEALVRATREAHISTALAFDITARATVAVAA